MTDLGNIEHMSQLIQFSTAPVVLLSSIGIALGVYASRLGRVVDRARQLESLIEQNAPERASAVAELRRLHVRAQLIYTSLALGTGAAAVICVLIAASFVGALLHVDSTVVVVLLFIVAVLCFGASLMVSLREVLLAIRNIQFRYPPELLSSDAVVQTTPAGRATHWDAQISVSRFAVHR